MQQELSVKTSRLYARRRSRRLWRRSVIGLAAVIVFSCTTYALILPAITLEPEPICGYEEHIHSQTCYTVPELVSQTVLVCSCDRLSFHIHTDACFDHTGALVCEQADGRLHQHGEICYVQGTLCCDLPEVTLHRHDENCWALPHSHTDACYTDQQGPLLCTLTDADTHTHIDSCYDRLRILSCPLSSDQDGEDPLLLCGLAEIFPHSHDGSCLDATGVLSCGLPQIEVHPHADSCFVLEHIPVESPQLLCSLEVHQHTADCYPVTGDPAASDTELAYSWSDFHNCGISAHEHQDACYSETGLLMCTMTEHRHDWLCDQVSMDFTESTNTTLPQELPPPPPEETPETTVPEGVLTESVLPEDIPAEDILTEDTLTEGVLSTAPPDTTLVSPDLPEAYDNRQDTDTATTYSVTVNNVNEYGELLSGAILGLYTENGELIAARTVDEDGTAEFKTDAPGGLLFLEDTLYYVQEIAPPEGYALSDSRYWFYFCTKTDCTAMLEGIAFDSSGSFTVVNQYAQYELPETGGSGRSSFLLWGTALMAIPLLSGLWRRRKEAGG